MKRVWIAYMCWVCVLHAGMAQDAWQVQRGAATYGHLLDVHFVDAQQGWAIGAEGILHTQDGGLHWKPQYSDGVVTSALGGIYFVDAFHGWAAPGMGDFILHTKDGGNIWVKQNIGTLGYVRAVHFVDENTGWALGNDFILHTTNGGKTWTQQTNVPFSATEIAGSLVFLSDVYFVDASRGWIVGEIGAFDSNGVPLLGEESSYILHTSDGGATWTEQLRSPTSAVAALKAVHFVNASVGWAAGAVVLHTVDGGATWAEQTAGSSHEDVYFVDSMRGWLLGDGDLIWRTVNGGALWESQSVPGSVRSVHFVDASTGWAAGLRGTILHTNDGLNWVLQSGSSLGDLYDVQFVDEQKGWTVGQQGLVLHTTDGGEHWNEQTTPSTVTLRGLHFLDEDIAWVVGDKGTILHTENGGAQWAAQTSGTTHDLLAVYFVDASTGWAVGKQRAILHTKDGGLSWASQDNPYTDKWEFTSLHFHDANTGWIAAAFRSDGGILSTTDGGETWEAYRDILNPLPGQTLGISFLDASTGWAVTSAGSIFGGSILHSTNDGGQSWVGHGRAGGDYTNVQVVHADTVYITSGTALRTYLPRPLQSNGLGRYLDSYVSVGVRFSALHFTDSRTGWLVGQKGVIVKTTRGGASKGFIRISAERYALDNQEQSVELRVASNASWTLRDGAADWIRLEDAEGNTDADMLALERSQVLTLHCGANTGSQPRVAMLTLRTTNGRSTVEKMLRVEQSAEAATLNVMVVPATLAPGTTLMSLPPEAGFVNLMVTSNVSWQLSVSAAWVSPLDMRAMPLRHGVGDAVLKVSYTENERIAMREAVLSFTLIGSSRVPEEISMIQLASSRMVPPALSLAPAVALPSSFPASASRHPFELRSNTAWSLAMSEAWAHFVDADNAPVTSGSGDQDIVLVIDANRLSSARRLVITGETTMGMPVAMLAPRNLQQAALGLTGLLEDPVPGISEIADTRPTVHIYPNPAEHRVSMTVGEEARMRLRNRHGEVLSTHTLAPGQALELDLDDYKYEEGLTEGVYFVEILTARGRAVRRLVLK